MVKYTLKILWYEHCKIFKVCLTIFPHYVWKCYKRFQDKKENGCYWLVNEIHHNIYPIFFSEIFFTDICSNNNTFLQETQLADLYYNLRSSTNNTLLDNGGPMITFPENNLASANKYTANNEKFEKIGPRSKPLNIGKTISSSGIFHSFSWNFQANCFPKFLWISVIYLKIEQ